MKKRWLAGVVFAALGAFVALAGSSIVQGAAQEAAGGTVIGTVRLSRQVMANGQALPAGTYQVRLTATEASPVAAGQTQHLERWIEFLQAGQMKGREVASIVPDSEISQVADGARPRPGAPRVELLKGGDYLRVWIYRDGNHYLIHLPVGA
jgi:hypothetical protein